MKISYHQASSLDAPEIAVLHNLCVKKDYAGHIPGKYIDIPVGKRRIEAWEGWVARSQVSTFVARNTEGMVGFTTLQPNIDADADSNAVELIGTYVLEPFWGQGIGRALFERALEEAKEKQFSQIVVWEIESNDTSRQFYETLGFHTDRESRIFLEQAAGPIREIKYSLET